MDLAANGFKQRKPSEEIPLVERFDRISPEKENHRRGTRQWYDWTMKEGQRPAFLQKHVAYFVTGLETWRYADDLEQIGTKKERLFLGSDGSASDIFHAGYLRPRAGSAAPADRYVYDPLDVRPEQLERTSIKNSITDDRYTVNLFGNGLVYYTEPFLADRVIAGNVVLDAWIKMDVPDTDFSISLNEVLPDGIVISLAADGMRARYRHSLREEHFASIGKATEYRFHTFSFFARRIQKGSRLRLVINCPNSIYAQKITTPVAPSPTKRRKMLAPHM